MPIKEYVILNFIGRSGTTILRNELGKYKNICTLPTNIQAEILKKLSKDVYLYSNFIKYYISNDITNIFGKKKCYKRVEDINKFIYKMPLQTLLLYSDLDVIKRFTPILIIREPIENVISASQKKFVEVSDNYKLFLKKLEMVYSKFSLMLPKNLNVYLGQMEIIEQRAILYKLAFKSTLHYLNNIYKGKYLIIKFENLLKQPVNVLSKILKFLNMDVSKKEILNKLNTNIYKDITEEGGIQMSSNLTSSHLNKYSNIDKDIRSKIEGILSEEIEFYNSL